MEVSYVREMDFIIQLRSTDGEDFFEDITAGSKKDAKKKMNKKRRAGLYHAGIVVANVKSNGEKGSLGDGTLPNTGQTAEDLVEKFNDDKRY